MTRAVVNVSSTEQVGQNQAKSGVETIWQHEKQPLLQAHIVPHLRTLRKAREQVNGWSKMGFLPGASSVTCIDGVCGG